MRVPRSALAAVLVGTLVLPAAGPIPDEVPDVGPVLSEPILRGEVVLEEARFEPPVGKTVDGLTDDWAGEASRIGGATVWDRGEHIYSDFLFDAHGADDGGDRDRLEQFAGALYDEERTWRVDQVFRTSGSQLGVPEPVGAPDEYGDVGGGLDVADLTEVRWAAGSGGDQLHLLVRIANLTDASRLGILVLADRGVDATGSIGLGTSLTTQRFDRALLLTDDAVTGRDVATGAPLDASSAEAVVSSTGWDNHLEARIPTALLADADGATLDVAVVAGRVEDDGSFTPINVAYRPMEPVEIFNDRLQALGLLAGTVDRFSTGPVAVDDLVGGRTQPMLHPGPGSHERQNLSAPEISREAGDDGIHQPYGLYVPSGYEPGEPTPATYWLHYRGGKAHSGTVINPRLTRELGEDRANLVFFPHGRGTSEWYVTESHQDVFEVMDDAEQLFDVDPTRRYVSGYSMGGYGSWLFTTLYPDLFAAAFVSSGAITQGAWVGSDHTPAPDPLAGQGYVEANDGDARAQLTYHALENLRHVPFAIDHGTDDELVPISGIERMAARLTELGYEHRLTRFLGYEHFSQAIMDEWADGADYLDRFTIDPNPRHVTYAVVPALVWSVNEVDPFLDAEFDFRPDGAYWVDDIVVRDVEIVDEETGRPADAQKGVVDVVSEAIEGSGAVPAVDTGAASPPGHSTPYVRSGLQYLETPASDALAPTIANRLVVDAANVASFSIDTARAGFSFTEPWSLEVTTDGPVTVRLVDALHRTTMNPHDVAAMSTSSMRFRMHGRDVIVEVADAGTHEAVGS